MTALSCGLLDGIIITILSNKRLTKVYNRGIILIEVVHLVPPQMLARLLWVHWKPSCWKIGWEPICTRLLYLIVFAIQLYQTQARNASGH